jgi:hypothetical protein
VIPIVPLPSGARFHRGSAIWQRTISEVIGLIFSEPLRLLLAYELVTRNKGSSVEFHRRHMGARARRGQLTTDRDRLAERSGEDHSDVSARGPTTRGSPRGSHWRRSRVDRESQPRPGIRPNVGSQRAFLALAVAAVCGCASGDPDATTVSSTSGFTAKIHYHYDALGRRRMRS